MVQEHSMIRVAFLNLFSIKWMGGVNYLKNLLYAISTLDFHERKIELVLFVGKRTDNELVAFFSTQATVVQSSLFDRYSSQWFVCKLLHYLTGSNLIITKLLRKHNISVVSHSGISGRNLPYKTINWIPDFQHVNLWEMFPKAIILKRNMQFRTIIRKSDCIVVSSNSTLKDLQAFMKTNNKVRVLHFVSQPDPRLFQNDVEALRKEVETKFGIRNKYFYLPNQFWKHKNHKIVFKAVDYLKKRGMDIQVVCTGYLHDYRNNNYLSELCEYIKSNGLSENIKILGLVDYVYVMHFMRNSVSIINPSLFEGWSSTVEEGKSIGKNMILSDISVHKEQDPACSMYFNPFSFKELAELIAEKWKTSEGGPDYLLEKTALNLLPGRIKIFALTYQNIVLEVVKS